MTNPGAAGVLIATLRDLALILFCVTYLIEHT